MDPCPSIMREDRNDSCGRLIFKKGGMMDTKKGRKENRSGEMRSRTKKTENRGKKDLKRQSAGTKFIIQAKRRK